MKKLFLLFLLSIFLQAKEITPSIVYTQVMHISHEIEFLHKYLNKDHKHQDSIQKNSINTKLKPRNVWQKSYEILIKLNILREKYNLPTVTPVNMAPVLNLNPNLVYEQTQRILTEIKIFKFLNNIKTPKFQQKTYNGKTPMDVFNGLNYISKLLDDINENSLTPSYVFAENMRIYDDISNILQYLGIEDKTIPASKNQNATPNDTFKVALLTLDKIKRLQIGTGIGFVDFDTFKKEKQTPSDVFSITQMIIAELQTIKAYIGLDSIIPSANKYNSKTPAEVYQLMSWNLRKLQLIELLTKGN